MGANAKLVHSETNDLRLRASIATNGYFAKYIIVRTIVLALESSFTCLITVGIYNPPGNRSTLLTGLSGTEPISTNIDVWATEEHIDMRFMFMETSCCLFKPIRYYTLVISLHICCLFSNEVRRSFV